MPRSGFGGAVTWTPAACRRSMTPFQLEASAKAPWTSTTVSGALEVASDMSAPSLAEVSTSMTASAKACGASCGRLWPMPPVIVRCA